MKYEFTLDGTVSVDMEKGPDPIGRPTFTGATAEAKDLHHSGFSESQIPAQIWSSITFRGGEIPIWPERLVDSLVEEVKAGRDISCEDYPDSAPDVEMALRLQDVAGKRVMVGGSISPWVEAIAIALGAKSVTTSDYNAAENHHPLIKTIVVPDLLRKLYSGNAGELAAWQHDLVVRCV
jgi:hypothetical protein